MVTDAELVSEHEAQAGEYDDDEIISIDEIDGPDDPLVDAIGADDSALRNFDPTTGGVDIETRVDLQSPGVDDLVGLFRSDWDWLDEDDEFYLELLNGLVQSVNESNYTENGHVDTVRHALNIFLRLDYVADERYDAPMAGWIADHIELLLETHNPSEEIGADVREIREGAPVDDHLEGDEDR